MHKVRGMTLLEVLVALFVFAVAASTAVKLLGESARNAARLEARYFAQLAAHNHLAQAQLAQASPALGSTSDKLDLAGYRFRWRQQVAKTPDAQINHLLVEVSLAETPQNPLYRLSLFKEAQR